MLSIDAVPAFALGSDEYEIPDKMHGGLGQKTNPTKHRGKNVARRKTRSLEVSWVPLSEDGQRVEPRERQSGETILPPRGYGRRITLGVRSKKLPRRSSKSIFGDGSKRWPGIGHSR